LFIDDVKIIGDKSSTLSTSSIIPEKNNIEIYPNPSVNGKFTLELPTEINDAVYKIFNLNGRLIQNGAMAKPKTKLNLCELTGMYLIQVIFYNEIYTRKLMIARN
jgi:hypothetical protein